jgi:hypothetical protein
MLDMDGTVTVPAIDFRAMHREVLSGDATYAAAREAGGGSVDILHCVESWVPHLWCRACDIIARFEQGGLDRLQIMPGQLTACGLLLITSLVGFGLVRFLHSFVHLSFYSAGASELCGFLDANKIFCSSYFAL